MTNKEKIIGNVEDKKRWNTIRSFKNIINISTTACDYDLLKYRKADFKSSSENIPGWGTWGYNYRAYIVSDDTIVVRGYVSRALDEDGVVKPTAMQVASANRLSKKIEKDILDKVVDKWVKKSKEVK